jgi:hypothetical protein
MESVVVRLKAHESKIQKVTDGIEASKPETEVVVNDH